MMGCHCLPSWSIMNNLMEDGNMDRHQTFHPDQLGVEEDLLGYQEHDEVNLPSEVSRPQIINPRTMRVNRYAIRDRVEIAIREALRRP